MDSPIYRNGHVWCRVAVSDSPPLPPHIIDPYHHPPPAPPLPAPQEGRAGSRTSLELLSNSAIVLLKFYFKYTSSFQNDHHHHTTGGMGWFLYNSFIKLFTTSTTTTTTTTTTTIPQWGRGGYHGHGEEGAGGVSQAAPYVPLSSV